MINASAMNASGIPSEAVKVGAHVLVAFDWVTRQIVSLLDKTPVNAFQAKIIMALFYLTAAYFAFKLLEGAAKPAINWAIGVLSVVLLFSLVMNA